MQSCMRLQLSLPTINFLIFNISLWISEYHSKNNWANNEMANLVSVVSADDVIEGLEDPREQFDYL